MIYTVSMPRRAFIVFPPPLLVCQLPCHLLVIHSVEGHQMPISPSGGPIWPALCEHRHLAPFMHRCSQSDPWLVPAARRQLPLGPPSGPARSGFVMLIIPHRRACASPCHPNPAGGGAAFSASIEGGCASFGDARNSLRGSHDDACFLLGGRRPRRHLRLAPAARAQVIQPHVILARVDDPPDAAAHLGERLTAQQALEHAVLHRRAEVGQRMVQPCAAAVMADIVHDDHQVLLRSAHRILNGL